MGLVGFLEFSGLWDVSFELFGVEVLTSLEFE